MKQFLALLLIVLLGCNAMPVAAKLPVISAAEKAQYDANISKLQAGDLTVDLRWMRLEHLKMNGYAAPEWDGYRAGMIAIDHKDFATALASAQTALKTDFMNLQAHLVAGIALLELHRDAEYAQDHPIALALYKAIFAEHDGLSAANAWEAMGIDEEYFVLRMKGLKMRGQSLINQDGHAFDRMDVTDPSTGKPLSLWFNIDAFFGKEFDFGK